ncbi:hypothetical protein L1047_04095 [Synechococcus sp. Nb3U1]|uniref:hypothetical protein n=1 Tax=Synechococcus sp. Nb3U1 TaxID=1914529 RepID=UPI001F1B9A34|nr:hypothetical protein [Synechococcus sp. Nb3U1]MCF2970377.1 hypothetical protein [Synechococcus sp. Nb3U1]
MFSFFKSNDSNNRQTGSHRTPASSKTTGTQRIPNYNRMSAPHEVLKQEKQLKREQEFTEMERSINRIHYFFQKADMPLEMRQVMTYRKLMELDYFTPQAAKELIRQWQQQEEQDQERRRA